MEAARILVTEDGPPHAICKIAGQGDGGYMVMAPYHEAREGWLAKYTADYTKARMAVPVSEMEHYTAEDQVKLSHHFDGFVQFSGERGGRTRRPVSHEDLACYRLPWRSRSRQGRRSA
jgi:hypothetical protein